MRGKEPYMNFVAQNEGSYISITIPHLSFKETPNVVKNFWEIKEGGNAKSKETILGVC